MDQIIWVVWKQQLTLLDPRACLVAACLGKIELFNLFKSLERRPANEVCIEALGKAQNFLVQHKRPVVNLLEYWPRERFQ